MIWQAIAFLVGIGVMAAPDLLGLRDSVANAFHVLGPIAASIAGMAAADVLRGLRRLHLLVGLAIAVAPIILGGEATAIGVGLAAGAVLVAMAFPGHGDPEAFGGGWRMLWAGSGPTDRHSERKDR